MKNYSGNIIYIKELIGCIIFLVICLFTVSESFAKQANKEKIAKRENIDPFTFKANIQGGVIRNFVGGLKTGSDYMGRVHLTLGLDTEKANLWKGGTFFINAVNAHGGTPTATLIGGFQPISRNEATERTGLFEFWYRHKVGKFSVLVGQHDMNSSFGTSDLGGQSVHSAFGMYPSITPNAGYSFSIFPRTMPAVYLKFDDKAITIQGAIYAGASKPFEEDRYNLNWNLNDSRFMVAEVHYKNIKNNVKKGHYKFGIIYHSGTFPDVEQDGNVSGNLGLYMIADHMIYQESEGSNEGLYLFAETGIASGNQNLAKLFLAGGILYKGLFSNRNEDHLFLAILNTSVNQNINPLSGIDQSNRTVIELNYALQLGEHFSIIPDFQYIINPGGTSSLDNAFLGVLRFAIKY